MKKVCAVCDRCKDKWADFSLSIRPAGANIDLKLVGKMNSEELPEGPVDVCLGCLRKMFEGIKLSKSAEGVG